MYVLDISTSVCLKQNYDYDYEDQDFDFSTIQFEQYTKLRCRENQLLIDNVCVNKCGNGILINQYEKCDDEKFYGGNGCSSFCQIENSYQCRNYESSFSLCIFIIAPEFNLNILSNSGNSLQVVELTFTQYVKLEVDVNFEDNIAFTIIPQAKYKLTIISISDLTIYLNNPKYQIYITIEFFEPVQNPILEVAIQKNRFLIHLNQPYKKMKLQLILFHLLYFQKNQIIVTNYSLTQ